MKHKSIFFAKVRGTDDRFRSVMFKVVFRKLRRDGNTWIDISDILSDQMPVDTEPRGDLLNHYYIGTKVPSPGQLFRILKALNKTSHTSSTVVIAMEKLRDQQKYSSIFFNKKYINDFDNEMMKIESKRNKAIKQATEQLKIHLSTLIYFSSTAEELNNLIESMIKEIHIEFNAKNA